VAFHSGREADHSPSCSAEVKEWVELTFTPPIRLHGVVLRGSTGTIFTFPSSGFPGALSVGVKWPGHEADQSPPSSAEAKNAWSYTSIPTIRLNGVVLG
jgi:hypothetical protein